MSRQVDFIGLDYGDDFSRRVREKRRLERVSPQRAGPSKERRNASRESLSIDLFSITDSDHKHEQPIVMDLVDDSVASDPDAPGGATTQFFRAWWSGVIRKLSDCLVEARPLVLIDLGKLLLC